MKIRIFTLALLISGLTSLLHAQIAMGKWRTHFAYNSVNQVTQSENKVFAVSEGALFSVDKEDQEMEFYSKLSGLNSNIISRIEYDKKNKQLLIIYSNGNIDVLGSGGIINISDFYNKQMSSSKQVNQITFYNDYAYLSCNFGIVVLNMKKLEIAETYYIGVNGSDVAVLNTIVHNGYIYALSSNAIYKADVSNPNLVNYQFWTKITDLPGSGDFKSIFSFSNKLILHRDNKIFIEDSNQTWSSIFEDINASYLSASFDKMYIGDNTSKFYQVDSNLNKTELSGVTTLRDAEYDTVSGLNWFAGGSDGVLSYKVNSNSETEIRKYIPKGPAVNMVWDMQFKEQKLVCVPGGRWAGFYNNPGDIMIFENGEWSNILYTEIEKSTGVVCRDFIFVAIDPFDKEHVFAASYSSGLYEFQGNKFVKWHNSSNSTLENLFSDVQYHMTSGITFDKDGNLWVLNSYALKTFKVLLRNGTWTELEFSKFRNIPTIQDLMISKNNPNRKWTLSARTSVAGVFIFDDNGTISDQSDDQSVFFPQFDDVDNSGGKITPINYYDIEEDKNGVVWVGTEQGPLLFYNTENVFKDGYTCSRVKISREDGTGLADYLLQSDKVKAIAIDGANRKWLGTETSGVYLMSENGQKTIQHFTTTNSPLLSNDVLSIEINPVTGEVYFGTSKGLVSYQGDALVAGESFEDVHAYPNPVRENFTGIITITGLVDNTQVKITDLNGNLICQTVSNGALATWDGKDVHGRKVSTGVYLVICANEDGTQSTITKIMVIN